ncbi:MAG: hypothetical protein QMB11_11935 [Nonlabens sp.]|jgi:hypothetical protein|uniref:hypothetical protein n=1 Tax=Nonlabens sp. TaxID=1888209 RepID=UPI0035A57BD2
MVNHEFLSSCREVMFLLKSSDRDMCISSIINASGVDKLREKGIRNSITKQEGLIFNIMTAIDYEEYSK